MRGFTRTMVGALAATAALAVLSPPAPTQQPPATRTSSTGYLAIAGIPNGPASVTVGGRARGNLTSEEMTLELPAGSYDVVVTKAGFSACRRTVTVAANDLVRVICRLGSAAARIISDASQNSWGAQQTRTIRIIHLEPSAVPIELGNKRGITPATVQLPVGDNSILLNGRALCLQVAPPASDGDTAVLRLIVRAGTPELVSGLRMCGPGALLPAVNRGKAARAPKSLIAAARRGAATPVAADSTVRPAVPPPPRPAFRVIDMDEAATRLAGVLRYIEGLAPESVRIGPGSAVPGADGARDVVRMTYADPQGRHFQFDQQRLPTPRDTSRAVRQRSLPASLGLDFGDTLVTSEPGGEIRLRWLDRSGLWLSLSGSLPEDALRALVGRVR